MKHLRPTLVLLGLFTLLTGVIYPLVVTGAANVLFSRQATGSMIQSHGRTVGSHLIGQSFSAPGHFWGRPSAVSYDAKNSSGTNLGPTNDDYLKAVSDRVQALHDADPDNATPVPSDLVTSSGSGLDPDISPDAAYYQAPRIARLRHLTLEQVRGLIDAHTAGRTFGILGDPRVNVLELNLALDDMAGPLAVESNGT